MVLSCLKWSIAFYPSTENLTIDSILVVKYEKIPKRQILNCINEVFGLMYVSSVLDNSLYHNNMDKYV